MSESNEKLIGVVVAVLLHALVALALTQESIVKWVFGKPKPEKVEKKEEPKPVLSFQIVPKKEVVPSPIPKRPKKPKFTSTNAEQAQGKPKNAQFIGERDTVAQSNATASATAPKRASVTGKKEGDFPNMASQSQEGKLRPTSAQVSQEQKVQPKSAEPKAGLDALKPLAGSKIPLVDYLRSTDALPSPPRAKKAVENVPRSAKGKELSDQLKEKAKVAKTAEKATPSKKKATPKSAKSSFKPTVDPTKMEGSITRSGRISSSDVAATPLGRYKQSIHNSVAKEWYRRIAKHPDLIMPGALLVRWYVYDTGKVRVVSVKQLQGSEIQKGITVQAVTTAKVPRISKKLKQELNGDPVEITITFHF